MASSTAAQRSAVASAVRAALAPPRRASRSSGGSIVPAFGGPGRVAQGPDDAPGVDRELEVLEPLGLLADDPLVELLAELAGEVAGLLVAGGAVGGDHHRPQVAQVELVAVGQRGVGAVVPLGGAHAGQQLLGDAKQLLAVDGGLAGGLALVVLGLDGLADAGDAAAQHLLGDRLVLGGQLGQDGLAVGAAGAEALGLGPLGQRRGSGVPGPAIGAVAGGTAATGARPRDGRPRGVACGRAGRRTGRRRRAWRAVVAVPPVAVAPALGDQAGGDELLVVAAARADQLDALGLLAVAGSARHPASAR